MAGGAGIGLALLVLLVLNTGLRRDVDDQLRALGGWRDLGLALALHGLIVAAIVADTPLLAWPLALLVTLGAVGNLAAVLTLLPAVALGRAGRVNHVTQLAHPASVELFERLLLSGEEPTPGRALVVAKTYYQQATFFSCDALADEKASLQLTLYGNSP